MRPFETVLLLANLLAFVGLVLPLPRAIRWMRFSAPVALLTVSAQIAAEGPRWQMMPAYALTGLLFLIWLWCTAATGHTVRGRVHRLSAGAAVGLGAVAMAFSIALPNVFPVFRFPRPTGPYAIGTLTYHWIDPTRLRALTADTQASRELMMQVWYRVWFDELMTLAALPERFSATLVANR